MTSLHSAAIRRVVLFDKAYASSFRAKADWGSSGPGKYPVVPHKRFDKSGKKRSTTTTSQRSSLTTLQMLTCTLGRKGIEAVNFDTDASYCHRWGHFDWYCQQ